jgi:hypothetical protein
VETTYDDVVGLQFEWFRFETFGAEPLAVNECTIGTFDILDINLGRKVILVFPREREAASWELPFRLVPILRHVAC